MQQKRVLPLCLVLFVVVATAQTAKRRLNERDYDKWKRITSQVLSGDGKFLAYAMFPEEGDGEVVVRNLATGKEVHESAGALPPAPDTTNLEVTSPADAAAARSVRMQFTHDNRFLISTSFPPTPATDHPNKDRNRPDEIPPPAL